MLEQLEHLAAMKDHRRSTLQVVQSSMVPTIGLLGGFVIAQLNSGPDTVYLDTAADTEHPESPAYVVSADVWAAFTDGVKKGEFDF